MRPRSEQTLLALSLVGLLLALYAVQLHYSDTPSRFCNVGENFNCDKVNKSPWSVFLGVPVALWGAAAYLVLFVVVLKRKGIQKLLAFTDRDFWGYLLLMASIMCAFQIYLTFAEIFFIHAYCIVCLGSQAIVLGVLALTVSQFKRSV
jgi:uncharacterized membrane protein